MTSLPRCCICGSRTRTCIKICCPRGGPRGYGYTTCRSTSSPTCRVSCGSVMRSSLTRRP